MANFRTLAAVFALACFSQQAQSQVSPVAIAEGISLGVSLFEKDPGNPSLDLLLENRNFLEGLSAKLDHMQEGIALILKEVGGLEDKVVRSSLEAARIGLGDQIQAELEQYASDLATLREVAISDAAAYPAQRRAFIAKTNYVLNEVTALLTRFKKNKEAIGTGSLTLIHAAYLEVNAKSLRHSLAGTSAIEVTRAAREYHSLLSDSLNPAITGSLAQIKIDLETKLVEVLENSYVELSMDTADPNIFSQAGRSPCVSHWSHAVVGTRWVRDGNMNRGITIVRFSQDWTRLPTIDFRFSGRSGSYFLNDFKMEYDQGIPNRSCPTNITTQDGWFYSRSSDTDRQNDPGGLVLASEFEREFDEWRRQFSKLASVYPIVLSMYGAAKVAQSSLERVGEGDFASIDIQVEENLRALSVGDLESAILDISIDEAAEDTREYREAGEQLRQEINYLVKVGDQRIEDALLRAASAAKTNSALGLVKMAALGLGKLASAELAAQEKERLEKVLRNIAAEASRSDTKEVADLAQLLNL